MSVIGTDICYICGNVYSCLTCPRCLGDSDVAKRKNVLLPLSVQMVLKIVGYDGRREAIKTAKQIEKYDVGD